MCAQINNMIYLYRTSECWISVSNDRKSAKASVLLRHWRHSHSPISTICYSHINTSMCCGCWRIPIQHIHLNQFQFLSERTTTILCVTFRYSIRKLIGHANWIDVVRLAGESCPQNAKITCHWAHCPHIMLYRPKSPTSITQIWRMFFATDEQQFGCTVWRTHLWCEWLN